MSVVSDKIPERIVEFYNKWKSGLGQLTIGM